MQPLSLLSATLFLLPALQALVYGSPLLERASKPACNADNPFLGKVQYANSAYATKLETTIASFLQEGDALNAARTRTVQSVGTFLWVASFADISTFETRLAEAAAAQRESPRKKIILPFVIYNLPERDCGAKASSGELSLDNDGAAKYSQFVDEIVALINTSPYNQLEYAIVLEPDSLGNIVTNLSVEKCALAQDAYKEGIAYAISRLQQRNVALYVDAAHSNWLGWPANLEPSAKTFKEVLNLAGGNSTIRGFSTNVSNYNAYNATTADIIYGGNPNWSELKYAKALAPYLEAEGLPSQFIIDQGRSGQQNIRDESGHWCNIADSGFGIRPTANTGDCDIDAIVWVKPGGESDGTSDRNATRFDENCQSSDAMVPAPEAGAWFNDFVKVLVQNANPVLEPTWA